MRISIIAILISLSALVYGQIEGPQGVIDPTASVVHADTITLSSTHQTLLPQLIREETFLRSLAQPGALEKAIADISEKINILLTAYVDPQKIQEGKVSFSENKIIVK